MCGIFGYSFQPGALSPSRRAVLATALARYNDQRGGMSYGVVGIKHGEPYIARGIGDLFDNAHFLCDFNVLFAHTRWASVGEVNVENAHPFEIGNILGAHNGGIANWEELNQKYNRKFEVDSQHIFAHLNEGRDLEELTGYGAIEWIHTDDPRAIHLCKFIDGELAIFGVGKDPEHTTGILWSSDVKHALKAIEAAGLSEEVFRFPVRRNHVYTIRNGELGVEEERIKISQYIPSEDEEEPLFPYGASRDLGAWYHAYGPGKAKREEAAANATQDDGTDGIVVPPHMMRGRQERSERV